MNVPPFEPVNENGALIGLIIPVCNEEECIGHVLDELLAIVGDKKFIIAVGVNNSSDRTAEIARSYPVVVAETAQRGYGHGCTVAIDALKKVAPTVGAYIFFAGDGASDPYDIACLTSAYEQGYSMVLGARTTRPHNWRTMGFSHVLANLSLGVWCGLLSARCFWDLSPLRLIERHLFEAIVPREMKFGWTIEAQIAAARLGATICEVNATERPRFAGEQKVSGVTWTRTFAIGCRILAAGWRTRRRFPVRKRALVLPSEVAIQSQPNV
jgi:hypothetical protein